MGWLIAWLCLGAASLMVVTIDKKWLAPRARGDVPNLASTSAATELAIYAAIGIVALPIHFYVSRGGALGLLVAIPMTLFALAVAAVLRFVTVLGLLSLLAR